MYNNDANHVEAYKEWGDIKGKPVRVREGCETKTLVKPTFGENLRFFFTYQVGHMYMRYFMWNFVGGNHVQGHGSFNNGNWISGIDILDDAKVGSRDKMPAHLKNDPSRNTYYFLPLLFGLIGMFYQYNRGEKGEGRFCCYHVAFCFYRFGNCGLSEPVSLPATRTRLCIYRFVLCFCCLDWPCSSGFIFLYSESAEGRARSGCYYCVFTGAGSRNSCFHRTLMTTTVRAGT